MDPADIIAHAASLTEADLAAILLAKCPSHIAGFRLVSVQLEHRPGGRPMISMGAGDKWAFVHETIDKAVDDLKEKLGENAADRAKIIRAHAAKLLAEANALDPQ